MGKLFLRRLPHVLKRMYLHLVPRQLQLQVEEPKILSKVHAWFFSFLAKAFSDVGM